MPINGKNLIKLVYRDENCSFSAKSVENLHVQNFLNRIYPSNPFCGCGIPLVSFNRSGKIFLRSSPSEHLHHNSECFFYNDGLVHSYLDSIFRNVVPDQLDASLNLLPPPPRSLTVYPSTKFKINSDYGSVIIFGLIKRSEIHSDNAFLRLEGMTNVAIEIPPEYLLDVPKFPLLERINILFAGLLVFKDPHNAVSTAFKVHTI